ncbi:hypothetical protein [Sediminicoccus sp. KRV36]|uniref:hypothetical protein n=1 Tax=Sediminicoccus sp. KRV36 TaxID=3133721 RepID=UPI00200E826C|nr:hypothetical protein [Sediminicoccus rosea]UPY36784.1 hypothetical protein LHU95_21605 [Sediminicoccus rosea]
MTLGGQARTGTDQRAVRFTFLCSASRGPDITGVLGLDLVVPAHDTLRAVFDFDPFEGPDARAGRLTQLESAAEAGSGAMRAMVSGSIGVDADSPFIFSVNAARRRDAARLAELSRLLAPLTTGASHLIWTQGNTRAGGPAITARLEASAEDAARLRALLGPCLPR